MKNTQRIEADKIQITPKTSLELKLWQKSLLGNIATKIGLTKEDLLEKVIGAGLHAILNNEMTFRLPLTFSVEDGFRNKKPSRKISSSGRTTITEEHLRSCFAGENHLSKRMVAKKLKELTGAGESTCYRVISEGGYLNSFLISSEQGLLKLKN